MPDAERGWSPRQPGVSGVPVLSARLVAFRRLYRWLNLTLVHQALWPLVLLLTSAPALPVARLPLRWYAACLAGPTLAALLAASYRWQRPRPDTARGEGEDGEGSRPDTNVTPRSPRGQLRLLLLGLPIMLAAARLIVGPPLPVIKLLVFGVADVAAFQLIHFGVVARTFPEPERGQAAAVGLFGVSWGLRGALWTAAGSRTGSWALAFVSGFTLGLLIALLSRLMRDRLGGFWPAAALHWLIVYLVFGFVR